MTRQENNRSQQISNDPERFLKVFKYYHKELDKWFTIEAYKERTDLYDKEAFLIELEGFNTFIKQYAEAIILHSYQALTETKLRTIETEQIKLTLQHYKRMVKEYERDGDSVFAYQLGKAVCDCIELFLDSLKLDFSLNVNEIGLCNDVKKLQSEVKEIINGIEPLLRILPINKTDVPQPDINDNPAKANFIFENEFDKTEPNKVYDYFNKTLLSKGHLSKQDLERYLILAFQDRVPPKEKITFSNKHIGNITAIFYKYYADADSKHGKQKQYAELLGEYFKGFTTEKVLNNFAKSK